jgi:hypothetical protein
MIDVVHRRLLEEMENLKEGALTFTSLGNDALNKFIHTSGKYQGLQRAVEIVEEIMRDDKEST